MFLVKNTLAVCLSAAMILQIVPTMDAHSAQVSPNIETVDGLTYQYLPDTPEKGECSVISIYDDPDTKCVTSHSAVSIPEKLSDYTVTVIGVNDNPVACNDPDEHIPLSTIVFPNTLRELHKNAFHEDYTKQLETIFINISALELVEPGSLGFSPAISNVFVYDPVDKTHYSTSDDIDKFRKLVSIEDVKFQPVPGTENCFSVSSSEFEKNRNLNGKLGFLEELAYSPYEERVGYMYAREIVRKYGFDDPCLPRLQKLEKISNFVLTNTRYSRLCFYDEDPQKCQTTGKLVNSPISALAFHSAICGGIAFEFDLLCRISMGDHVAERDHDIICAAFPGHIANAVRLEHSDDDSGYYMIDNTLRTFMQGEGTGLAVYSDPLETFMYDSHGIYSGERTYVELAKEPDLYHEGISLVYIHDETPFPLHIEMSEKGTGWTSSFIDCISYMESSPDMYLEQLPTTKCGAADPRYEGMKFYADPSKEYEFRISDSDGEYIFSGEGEHRFTLGNTELVCYISRIPYNTETPYGTLIPHTAYDDYLDVVIKPVSNDIMYGDANCDNKISVADSVAVLQYILSRNKYSLSDKGMINADCCNIGDGITGSDAIAIQMLDAGVIESLPIADIGSI